ncbi:endonuclease/exonuclease/phosphatase family protein [Spirosoma sp. BT702]|uniref:Endonuclease/exonuclease/phosphatase family protein n=1 Tax=Spirosoma profusum TaxID=2771354 RepID=A0A927AQB8_9BACT|nr:endonuclease/exonuclease/phosphatase family protein [Spirosoma profusum]MBD2700016.1 endonuclease/exonuclease/phosphatase family protein [Spirosoma profusum]
MKKLIILFLISITTYAYEGPVRPVTLTNQKSAKLRVMTYNIHHCNPPSAGNNIEVDAIARVINQEKPDLVALQEVDVNTERSGKGVDQANELARLTGMHYFFSKAIDHQGGDYGVAVLSRFPILESVRYTLPVDPAIGGEIRTIAAITVDVAKGKRIVFASTHLDLKEENRTIQSELIIKHFGDSKLPMILAGDFNALPDSKVIQYFDKTFVRSCQECGFTIPVKNPNRVIDFVMYKSGDAFENVSTRVIDEQYASDHLPVVADLTIK